MLFGIAFAVPSLCFVGLSYLLFSLGRCWVTIFLSLGAIGIFLHASSTQSEAWNVALAVVIATAVHQLTLLLLQRDAANIGRSIK